MADARKWIVLVLKDRFSNDTERESLKRLVLARFPRLGERDVYYVPYECSFAFCNFLFVRENDPENDLRDMLEVRREAFEPYPSHMRITDGEFARMVDGVDETRRKATVKYGDIVTVRKGTYSKLNGIVLREDRSGRIDVGLKFCFGTVVERCDVDELVVKGNIFEYLKVLK